MGRSAYCSAPTPRLCPVIVRRHAGRGFHPPLAPPAKEGERHDKTDALSTVMIAAAVAVACAVALSAVSEKKAEAAFPGQNGRIAYFVGPYPEDYEIYSIKPDGTDRKQLTDNSADDRAPDISPDGKWIAFTRNGNLYKATSDGSGEPSAVEGPAESWELAPDWGPMPTTTRR